MGKTIRTPTKAMAGPANSHLRWLFAQRASGGVESWLRALADMGSPKGRGGRWPGSGTAGGQVDAGRVAGAWGRAGPVAGGADAPPASRSLVLVVQQLLERLVGLVG